MRDFTVELEPKVVGWAVESSGMGHGAVAKALRVATPQVETWIRTGRMKYSKMRGLAKCVKRPEAALLLKSPPREKTLVDYRMMKGASSRLSPGDLLQVRKVRYAQSAAREMMEVQGASAEPKIGAGATAATPPEQAARGERSRLGAEERADGALRGPSDMMFGRLREAVESLNILVFQYPMDAGAVRGLSMTDALPYAILVNSRDARQVKAVTLLHEYGHALLGKGGICREEDAAQGAEDGRIEAWCGRFAAAFLMPEGAFARERDILEESLRDAGSVVDQLARKFKAGRHAAAARAAGLPGGRYAAAYKSLARQSANRCAQEWKGGGGPSHADRIVARLGRRFVGLTLSSHSAGIITTHDVSDYLGTSLEHLEAIQAKMEGAA